MKPKKIKYKCKLCKRIFDDELTASDHLEDYHGINDPNAIEEVVE